MRLLIKGGRALHGEVRIKAAKNAVLPILAASVLADGECEICDVPKITDIDYMLSILRSLGSDVTVEDGHILIRNQGISDYIVPAEPAKELRSSFFLLGPLLGRMRRAVVSYPGGCDIGVRPLDIHIKGLREMGIAIEESHGKIYCDGNRLKGADIALDFPSVGATENLMMAAALAKGTTRISNAAKEPEIVDLQNFINAMGGKVSGAGSGKIVVEGVEKLHGCRYTPIPDRIVAGTILIAGAVCGGDVSVANVIPEHLEPLLFKINKSTCQLTVQSDRISLVAHGRPKVFDKLETQPYPGFPTDLQSQIMVMMSVAEGTGVIVENIFETRFRIVRELTKMGAIITVKDRTAVIRGVNRLEGAAVSAADLRGGAALVIAGAKADGYTTIDNARYIDRGYEAVEELFGGLGVEIKRIR